MLRFWTDTLAVWVNLDSGYCKACKVFLTGILVSIQWFTFIDSLTIYIFFSRSVSWTWSSTSIRYACLFFIFVFSFKHFKVNLGLPHTVSGRMPEVVCSKHISVHKAYFICLVHGYESFFAYLFVCCFNIEGLLCIGRAFDRWWTSRVQQENSC